MTLVIDRVGRRARSPVASSRSKPSPASSCLETVCYCIAMNRYAGYSLAHVLR